MVSVLLHSGLIFAACCLACRQVYWRIRHPEGYVEMLDHDCLVLTA